MVENDMTVDPLNIMNPMEKCDSVISLQKQRKEELTKEQSKKLDVEEEMRKVKSEKERHLEKNKKFQKKLDFAQ